MLSSQFWSAYASVIIVSPTTTSYKLPWQFFGLIQCIVSIVVAVKQNSLGGYPSATFAAIWSMFLCILFTTHGAQIVFGGVSSELGVGFMIGVAAMMTQLFFVLMCIFFVLSTEAKTAGYGEQRRSYRLCKWILNWSGSVSTVLQYFMRLIQPIINSLLIWLTFLDFRAVSNLENSSSSKFFIFY